MADADPDVPVDQGPPAPHEAVDDWSVPPPDLPQATATDPGRPGPEQIEADSWDGDPSPTVIEYEGRRRAQPPPTRLGLIIGLAVAALAAAVVLPFLLSGSPDDAGSPLPAAVPTGFASAGSSTSAAVSTTITTTAASPTAVPTTTRAVRTTTRPAQPVPPPPTTQAQLAPFAALTFEAEQGPQATLAGSANVRSYDGSSGGLIVFNVGNWGMGNPGSVTFHDIVIPTTGTYVVTIIYVHPDGQVDRSATITVSGVSPTTVPFVGSAACCHTKTVSFVIPAGTHTLTIGNPTDRGPALDKVTITRL